MSVQSDLLLVTCTPVWPSLRGRQRMCPAVGRLPHNIPAPEALWLPAKAVLKCWKVACGLLGLTSLLAVESRGLAHIVACSSNSFFFYFCVNGYPTVCKLNSNLHVHFTVTGFWG